MLETDSPYLTPVPHRGKRNEPSMIINIAEAIAKIRNFLVLALSHKLYYRDPQGYTPKTAATDGNTAATINYGYVVNEIFFRIAARY